jgi:hypothetical protein
MLICIHECRYMLINQYLYESLTNQEMGDQIIKKWWPGKVNREVMAWAGALSH